MQNPAFWTKFSLESRNRFPHPHAHPRTSELTACVGLLNPNSILDAGVYPESFRAAFERGAAAEANLLQDNPGDPVAPQSAAPAPGCAARPAQCTPRPGLRSAPRGPACAVRPAAASGSAEAAARARGRADLLPHSLPSAGRLWKRQPSFRKPGRKSLAAHFSTCLYSVIKGCLGV